MAIDTFTLNGQYENLDGTPAAGKVRIDGATSQVIRDPDNNVIFAGPRTVVLDVTGSFSVTLPTDSTLGDSANIGYRVTAQLKHQGVAAIEFYAPAAGSTVYTSDYPAGETVTPLTPEGVSTAELDALVAAEVEQSGSATNAALAGTFAEKTAANKGPTVAVDRLRAFVRAGGVTTTNPLVGIGDSHTDSATSAVNFWTRLSTLHNQPGEGLEGIPSAAILARGNNGQSLAAYLGGSGPNTFADAMALDPSVVLACWLTNDVRQGGLGLTTDAIRAAGANLLRQFVANVKAAQPDALIVLRVPAPYTTADAGDHYITDGTNNNPAGLAQTYTDGVRLAYYDTQATYPEVIVYDPQTRFFGTTSPTANGGANTGYFANQIHQNVDGYRAEADDFAAFVAAQKPYNPAATFEARKVGNPSAPWLAYWRAVEDPEHFLLVGRGRTPSAITAGQTFVDVGSYYERSPQSQPAPTIIPGNLQKGDIIQLVGAKRSFALPTSSAFTWSGNNVRITGLGAAITVPAAAFTEVRIYRAKAGSDTVVNGILGDTSWRFKVTGIVGAGGTTFVDLEARSFGPSVPTFDAATWATMAQAGDKVYIEGQGSTAITLAASGTGAFAASGNRLRITGLTGTDYSTMVGKMVVLVGTHA